MKRTTALPLIALVAALAACSRSEPPLPPESGTAAPVSTPPSSPPQAEAREARVKSLAPDGTEIRYRVYGSGEPALVFVHGWSCDSGYWDAQLNHFATRHTVITVDLAGHGDSPSDRRSDWSMANFGADVAAAVAIPAVIALMEMDYREALDALDLPIVALNSASSPTDEATIRQVEPRFSVVALADVGYFPMLEDPRAFNRMLERIVAEWVQLEPERNPLSRPPRTG